MTISYFNPRAPRGARRSRSGGANNRHAISIHVPREGHDGLQFCDFVLCEFQSTCPARGTTSPANWYDTRFIYFNPRAPRGARPLPHIRSSTAHKISIHVPREGHDDATKRSVELVAISIHVPREGHDSFNERYFNDFTISIHVPREGHDRQSRRKTIAFSVFQSTCPARGTTMTVTRSCVGSTFQSTCPARGTTSGGGGAKSVPLKFQSTCPARGTTKVAAAARRPRNISIHVPREGHDKQLKSVDGKLDYISIHVPREGHDARYYR